MALNELDFDLKGLDFGLKGLDFGLNGMRLGLNHLSLEAKIPRLIWLVISFLGLTACNKPPINPKLLPNIVWHSCEGVDLAGVTSRCGRYYPYINSLNINGLDINSQNINSHNINSLTGNTNKTENHSAAGAKGLINPQLYISFSILTPSNSPVNATPVVFMAGGPGEGGNTQGIKLERWRYWLLDNPIKRPLIVWDSRGNQGAWGYFECESYRLWSLNQLTQISLPSSVNQAREQLQLCIKRWRQLLGRQSFQSFSSEQNAQDILGALNALGYNSWHVLSISYGSRVAQWLAVLAPQKTKSLVLDSPYSWQVRTQLDQQQHWLEGYERFFAACDKQKECSALMPSSQSTVQVFERAITRLDQNPLTLKFELEGYQHSAVIGAETFAHLLFALLYDPNYYPQAAVLLAFVASGQAIAPAKRFIDKPIANARTGLLSQLLAQSYAKTANPWLFWLTQCNDNDQVIKHDVNHPQIPAKWRRFLTDNTQAMVCELTKALPSSHPPKVISNKSTPKTSKAFLPAVILSGNLDPVTPTAKAYEVAQAYQSVLLQAAEAGHGLFLSDACLKHKFYRYWHAPRAVIGSLHKSAKHLDVPEAMLHKIERFDSERGTNVDVFNAMVKKGCRAQFFNMAPLPYLGI